METLLGRSRFQGKGLESSVADVEKETSGDNKVKKSLRQMHGRAGEQEPDLVWRHREEVSSRGVVMEDVADFAGRM